MPLAKGNSAGVKKGFQFLNNHRASLLSFFPTGAHKWALMSSSETYVFLTYFSGIKTERFLSQL